MVAGENHMTVESENTKAKEIVEKLRIRAEIMLADVKFQIDLNFDDPQYKRIMWLTVMELAKKYAGDTL